ncbi:MAG: stage II sporulation protein M [Methanoregula sp.]|nr:stage II sporulation protein M [Methanoregula sp.]
MFEMKLSHAILITLFLFSVTLVAGWIGTTENPEMGTSLMELFEKEVVGQLKDAGPSTMVVNLFINNLEACILLFLGGATFGLLTFFIMSLNGVVIGAIMQIIHEDHSVAFIAAAILPHGIFEIPAFLIAGALGIMVAHSLVAEWYDRADAAAEAHRCARMFGMYVLPLVTVAATVEAFITPAIIRLVS